MLGAALKEYDRRVEKGEAQPPPPMPPVTQPPLQPPSMAGLHVSNPGSGAPMGGRGLYSQSLPSSGHLSLIGRGPPKPRVRPMNPMGNLAELPILELPEPSPHSNSLLESNPLGAPSEHDEEEDFTGGTCAATASRRPRCTRAPSPPP